MFHEQGFYERYVSLFKKTYVLYCFSNVKGSWHIYEENKIHLCMYGLDKMLCKTTLIPIHCTSSTLKTWKYFLIRLHSFVVYTFSISACFVRLRLMLVWHLHDSVALTGTTGVVPVRKLVVNLREVCVNLSWLRSMSGREFWNVQNFGHDRI